MLGLLVCLKFYLMVIIYTLKEKWTLIVQDVIWGIAHIVNYLQINASVQECACVTNVRIIRRSTETMWGM